MKKLLVLLGAGSSISHGMPSLGKLDTKVKQWSTEGETSSDRPFSENFYCHVWDSLEAYYRKAHTHLELRPNFEIALGQLLSLANWVRPAPHGNPLRLLVANDALPAGIRFTDLLSHYPVPSGGFGPSTLVNNQLTHLLIQLAKYMRKKSLGLDNNTGHFKDYSDIFKKLAEQFDVGVYTLNYDTVALSALAGIFTGFSTERYYKNRRRFDAASVHVRRKWGFLYHLHGSVHHTVADHGGENPLSSEITWQDDLTGGTDAFEDGAIGRSLDKRSEGVDFPVTSLVVGGFKLDQLLKCSSPGFVGRIVVLPSAARHRRAWQFSKPNSLDSHCSPCPPGPWLVLGDNGRRSSFEINST